MTHPDGTRLHDYADGLLDVDAGAQVEEHLAGCIECRQQVQAIRELTDRLAGLPPISPRRDLRPAPPRRRRVADGVRPWLRAAVIAAVVAGAGAGLWVVAGPDSGPTVGPTGAYARAAADLTAALELRKSELGPDAVRALETNLAAVDTAIRELERARRQAAAGSGLDAYIEARYRTKLDLLRGALELLEES